MGLLSQFGVNFGNEEIQYQDLAFHLNWEQTSIGNISFFGFGGLSSNDLSPLDDPENWEVDKDGVEVDFDAGMGAVGIRQSVSLGSGSSFHNSLVYSGRYSERQSQTFYRTLEPYDETAEEVRQELYSFKSTLSTQHSASFSSDLGIALNYYRNSLKAVPGNFAPLIQLEHTLSYAAVQPFAQVEYAWSADWLLSGGLRLLYDSQNEELYPEPRLLLKRELTPGSNLQLSYSLLSQPMLNQPHLLPSLDAGEDEKAKLEPVRSHYTGLGYEKSWGGQTNLKTKVFYQYFDKVPSSLEQTAFSTLNTVEEYALWPLASEGEGQIYGLDASLQRFFTDQYYYLLSLSLFDATYQGTDGTERNMRFNSQYSLSLTAGREWTALKEDYQRIWGVHLRTLYRGGYWYTPVNESASQQAGTTLYDYSRAFSERLPAYFSLDLRISHTKEKQDYTRIWFIDIQNLTMQENIGWYYYDQLQEEVKAAYQLGIIPVVGYRIEF